jgi:CRISPR/Cas system Type II protein with McrA/HNH and RuvC-like nuclease domain
MAISKKIRFEVFKRDGFRCSYCGSEPPSIILEVDHIEPSSRGGTNDINNLITSCFSCNRGKKNIPLSVITTQLQENLEVLREKEEQLKEYRKFVVKITQRIQKDINDISKLYIEQYPKWRFSDTFKEATLKTFLKRLPKHEIIEALHIAIAKHPFNADRVIPYFCGICWNKIKGTVRKYE